MRLDIRDPIGKTTSRTCYGQEFYIHLPLKNLSLSKGIVRHIVAALQESVGDGMTEVLPTLENFLGGSFSDRNLSREAFGSLLPRGSYWVAL
jgi:hypothetical protein